MSAIREIAFKAQRKMLEDPSRLKAGLGSRRAGTTYCAALALIDAALDHPGSTSLYVGPAARWIFWPAALQIISQVDGALASPDGLTFGNGSTIRSVKRVSPKVIGHAYQRVVIDGREADERTIYADVLPTTVDRRGDVWLLGTPWHHPHDAPPFFRRVTEGYVPGWAVHKWTAAENPHVADAWAAESARMRAEPSAMPDSAFATAFMGRWP